MRERIDESGNREEFFYDREGNLILQVDQNGNRIERNYTIEGKVLLQRARTKEGEEEVETTYRYDSLYQLKEESYGEKKILYAYDKAGNRTERRSEEGEEKYEYNERNQLVKWKKGEEERRFTYDKEESIIREERKEGVREYEYHAEKQLICIRKEKGEEQRNYYDAEGQRTESERRGKRKRYLYYKGELFEEKGEKERSYVFGYGIEALEEEGKEYYYHKDERNSTTYLSNERREIENRYVYDGYGRSQRKDEGVENAIQYTGQRYEEELEGYCLGVREYREEYGRFLTEDAYEGDGTNLYAYCRNNPIKYYDPSGYSGEANEKGHTTPEGEEGKTPSAGTEGGSGAGKLTVLDGEYSVSERNAAKFMADQGNNVVLRPPVGTRADGGTSDLLVNGVNYDVYTPKTSNSSAIIRAITKKNTQTTGVVLDLSETTVSANDLGNILARVKGAIEKNGGVCNIDDIIVMPK